MESDDLYDNGMKNGKDGQLGLQHWSWEGEGGDFH